MKLLSKFGERCHPSTKKKGRLEKKTSSSENEREV